MSRSTGVRPASVIEPGFWTLLGVLTLFSWTGLVGVVRAEFLRARNFDYVRAARALGMSGQIGELAEGGFADLVALPFAGKVSEIYDAVLHHAGDVAASMIDGQWAIAPT